MAAPVHRCYFVLRSFIRRSYALQSTFYSTSSSDTPESSTRASPDPMPVFMKKEVQTLLKSMTGFDIMRVAGPQKMPLKKPHYKLLTDEEVEKLQESAQHRVKYRLQMPPFMKAREPINEVLSSDPELSGLDNSKFVFTDITFGTKDRQRLMVVRDVDGTLRRATWEERDRINQIYHPMEGRQFHMPAMFKEENLEALLKRQKFVYVLDMACIQFEPDNPEYIRVTHRTFEAVESTHSYEDLHSTRHFGPMAFYYAWYQKIDYLLIDMINRDLMTDAGDLVKLYCIVHPSSAIAQKLSSESITEVTDAVQMYLNVEAKHKGQLELALQGYKEKLRANTAASKTS